MILATIPDDYDIPPLGSSTTSVLDEEGPLRLLDLSRRVVNTAQTADSNIYNKYRWKQHCYTEIFSTLGRDSLGTISVVAEEEWRAITTASGVTLFIPPDVFLGPHKPDYSSDDSLVARLYSARFFYHWAWRKG